VSTAKNVKQIIKEINPDADFDVASNPEFLHAGPGYGGSCFPKDTKALIKIFHDNNITPRIVEAVVQVNEAKKYLKGVNYFNDPYNTAERAEVVVIMTEWNEYRALDLNRLKAVMKGNVFVDLKGIYAPESVKDLGFVYVGVGV